MELIMSIANVAFFLWIVFIVLRIYYTNRRAQILTAKLLEEYEADMKKREEYMTRMRLELESLNQVKRDLDQQVEECRQHLSNKENKQGGNINDRNCGNPFR